MTIDIRTTCPMCNNDYIKHTDDQFQTCFEFIITSLDSLLDDKRESLSDFQLTCNVNVLLDMIQKIRALK